MLETAIVGGGLCGLALADNLQTLGRDYLLFEARERLGGRIRSVRCESIDAMLDLGPTWFWPATEPSMAGLVTALGLTSFAQHDDGTAVELKQMDGRLEPLAVPELHGGAHRLEGGMAALVHALAARLPADRLRLAHVLDAVCDRGDHVELHLRCGEGSHTIRARRVVLAMPPRLVEERVRFEPALPAPLREALRATPTWMASAAKAVVGYPRAWWREAGHSGNAFVTHEHAMLAEIFDACDASGTKAALGGFVALSPAQRETFRGGLPMLIHSQFAHLYGPQLEQGELHYQDWALEPHTAATADVGEPPPADPAYGDALLAEPHWNGRLLLGGSETAAYGGGRLEGALAAAGRLRRQIVPVPAAAPSALGTANDECVARFGAWVAARRSEASDQYRRRVQQALSAQQRDGITQRAVLDTVERVYRGALDQLRDLPFDMGAVGIARGRSDLTPHLLASFMGFSDALLEDALRFNRTSCAMSNFPAEHEPAPDYVNVIRRHLAAAWREFALGVNGLLLELSDPVQRERA